MPCQHGQQPPLIGSDRGQQHIGEISKAVCQETAEKYCPILPLVVWICPRGTITCL